MGPKLVFTYWDDEELSEDKLPTFSLDGFAHQILCNKMSLSRIISFHPFYAKGLDTLSLKAQEITQYIITELSKNQPNELLLAIIPKEKSIIVLYLLQKRLFKNTLDLHNLCSENRTAQDGLYVCDRDRNIQDFFDTYCLVQSLVDDSLHLCTKRHYLSGVDYNKKLPYELTSPENFTLS